MIPCLLLIITLPLPSIASTSIKVGAAVLRDHNYSELSGKRVGLITNQSAVIGEKQIADIMISSGKVKLVAIFAPEHGYKGQKEDGVTVGSTVDEQTGIQVYSLYGTVVKPTPEMMKGIDVLVFDIQGIGTRFYTYISTMGLAMEAAAEAHVPFIVLDRPNPLGGEYVSGPVLEKEQISFTGEYPIPVAHGMTIGELALMIKGEKMLPGLDNLDLHVIRIAGWQRNMEWPETELPWIRTSPNIPDFETALLYPGIGLFEGTSVSVGRGTSDPFKVIGFPGIDTDVLAKALNSKKLPGVRFEKTTFTPLSIPGMSSSPAYKGKEIAGIRITVSDPETFQSVETGVQILSALYSSLGDMDRRQFFKKSGFDHLAGTTALRLAIEKGLLPEDIINSWQKKNELYLEKRDKYLLY